MLQCGYHCVTVALYLWMCFTAYMSVALSSVCVLQCACHCVICQSVYHGVCVSLCHLSVHHCVSVRYLIVHPSVCVTTKCVRFFSAAGYVLKMTTDFEALYNNHSQVTNVSDQHILTGHLHTPQASGQRDSVTVFVNEGHYIHTASVEH